MNARPDPMLFLAVTPSMRQRIESTVETLLTLLDIIDGDADLEDDFTGEPEETDQNGDEGDYSGGESDPPGLIAGGQGL